MEAQKTNKKNIDQDKSCEARPRYYIATSIVLPIVNNKLLLINKIRNDFIINPIVPYVERTLHF